MTATGEQGVHLPALDGWRGISILLVLAAHLLPLGPHAWELNYSAGILGMALFFTLSGYLITSVLLRDPHVPRFLIRRGCRIIPLAWLYCLVALGLSGASTHVWLAHLLFYANVPPPQLQPLTLHLWSLCVEMQFYVGVALLVAAFRQRGLWLLPVLAVMFSLLRAYDGVYASAISYYRVDEILAGCTLALVMHGKWGGALRDWMADAQQWALLALLVVSCLPAGGWLNYLRPYFAALLVGATLLSPHTRLARSLGSRTLVYLALTSYALYVIHPLLAGSWLGEGDRIEKYLKRPLLLLVLFALAHLSTHYFERWFIALGHRLTGQGRPARAPLRGGALRSPVRQRAQGDQHEL